jgi:hypothetical protein
MSFKKYFSFNGSKGLTQTALEEQLDILPAVKNDLLKIIHLFTLIHLVASIAHNVHNKARRVAASQ